MILTLLLITALYWAFAITSRVKNAERELAELWRQKATRKPK